MFEEAAVDLGEGLQAWSDARSGKRKGKRVGFPRFKKTGAVASFRLRNKHPNGKPAAIRIAGPQQAPPTCTPPACTPPACTRPDPTMPAAGSVWTGAIGVCGGRHRRRRRGCPH
ncbi:hypothetical protein MDOR_03330 [Mycolicibacterium doricum]|uniref:Uncharacterized protein n=1 Tax=Mycolicibacterium doricum TaxID=126673 RepID=A0A7I7VLP1_9MYCO|nr:hypothetical protein MDOR_03330 [Mycolicibacterium doricum]